MRPDLRVLIGCLAVLVGVPGVGPTLAAEFRSGDSVAIKKDEVIEGDLYAFADRVLIEGTIKGDLVAFGREISVTGSVEGDLIASGQTVLVDGRVTDDARIAGYILKLTGKGYAGGDLIASGFSLECESNSEVAGDVVYAGAQGLLAGKIGRDLTGVMANCQLDGEVARDVSIEVGGNAPVETWDQWLPEKQRPAIEAPDVPGGFTVGPTAKVGGKLSYQALEEADIADPKMAAAIEFRPLVKEGMAKAPPTSKERIFGHLAAVAPLALFGLLVVLVIPGWLREMADTIRYRPLASLIGSILGALVLLILVVLLVIVMSVASAAFGAANWEAAAGFSVFLGLLSTTALVVSWLCVMIVLAPAIASTALGRLFIRSERMPTIVAFLLGIVLLIVLTWIPVAGAIIGGIALWLGIGAFCVWMLVGPPPETLETVAVKR